MQRATHLRRHPATGVYYFRIAVPHLLVPVLGKTEIVFSLQTRDPAEAKRLSYFYSAYWMQELATVKSKGPSASGIRALQDDTARKAITIKTPSGYEITAYSPAELQQTLEQLAKVGAFTIQDPIAEPTQIIPDKDELTLGQAIEKQTKIWKKHIHKPKTLKAKVKALHDFEAYLKAPRRRLNNITKKDLSAYRDSMMAAAKSPETVLNKIIYVKQMFGQMIADGYMRGPNPAEGIVRHDKKQKLHYSTLGGWREFNSDHIHFIFKPKDYLSRKRRYNALPLAPAEYFLPLLCLYTGARVNELAQLDIEDVNTRAASGFIELTFKESFVEKPDKNEKNLSKVKAQSLKTAASARVIPLHPDLEALGFKDYVRAVARMKRPDNQGGWKDNYAIFPYLNKTDNGKAGRESTAFNRYLERLNITNGKFGFHSFRKTFTQRVEGVDSVLVDYYQGWKRDNTRMQHYLTRISPEALATAIFPHLKFGLDLRGLRHPIEELVKQIERQMPRRERAMTRLERVGLTKQRKEKVEERRIAAREETGEGATHG